MGRVGIKRRREISRRKREAKRKQREAKRKSKATIIRRAPRKIPTSSPASPEVEEKTLTGVDVEY